MPSRKPTFAAEARRDLRTILRHTLKTWGDAQRVHYARRVNDTLQQLTRFPELGRTREDIDLDLREYPVGEHLVYYRVDGDSILVLRILHRRMDVVRHLTGE